MTASRELLDLPLLPRDETGPVFAEPWQAQVFAVVVGLIESGQLAKTQWAESLGAALKEAERRGEYDTGRRYYDHWLMALERLVVANDLAGADELANAREAIREDDHHNREHQLKHHDE